MHIARYRRTAGVVYNLHYHLVWCPKYRRPVLSGAVEARLTELLTEKAAAMDVQIEALEVMPDHVRLFVAAPPTDAPQHLANQFKGYTSRALRQEFPQLRSRLPTLWSRSYYISSVGQVSEEAIKQYIASQKERSWVRKAFKYRLYSTGQQEQALAEMLDTHRHLYNRALAERKSAWEERQESVSYGQQSAHLKDERTTNLYLARTNFSSCQATLRRLDRAFLAFFRRLRNGETPGYPRFKGQNRFDTLEFRSYGDGCKLDGTLVYFHHIGHIKIKLTDPLRARSRRSRSSAKPMAGTLSSPVNCPTLR
jgi:putative transposase